MDDMVVPLTVAITDIDRVPKLINDFEKRMFEIGMSPFKGF